MIPTIYTLTRARFERVLDKLIAERDKNLDQRWGHDQAGVVWADRTATADAMQFAIDEIRAAMGMEAEDGD